MVVNWIGCYGKFEFLSYIFLIVERLDLDSLII